MSALITSLYQQLRAQYELLLRAPLSDRDLKAAHHYKYAPFSSHPDHTLRPGPLYLMGLKPLGRPGQSYPFPDTNTYPRPDYHLYLDAPPVGNAVPDRARQLVEGLQQLLGLPADLRTVFSTNLYHFRAEDSAQLQRFGLTRIDCWPYHEQLLAVVQPRILVCVGNGKSLSAFQASVDRLGGTVTEHRLPGQRAFLRLAQPERPYPRLILGVPHLSYYEVTPDWWAILRPVIEAVDL